MSEMFLNKFSHIDDAKLIKTQFSNVTDVKNVQDVIGYNFQLRVPFENRLSVKCVFFIRNIDREYDIILGVNFLKDYAIELDFKKKKAFLKF